MNTIGYSRSIELPSGILQLQVNAEDLPLDSICGFASRRSKKRGFVFVSRVLGKHIPVRPKRMREIHQSLADKIEAIDQPTLIVGMAETATALAHGIFECLPIESSKIVYIQTTRYRLSKFTSIDFEESHSHAADIWLHLPEETTSKKIFFDAKRVIIIDDEFSTGSTAIKLIEKLKCLLPKLQSIDFVCITDWMGISRKNRLEELAGLPIQVHAILHGEYSFHMHEHFVPDLAPSAVGTGTTKDHLLSSNFGREGLCERLDIPIPNLLRQIKPLSTNEKILILGTGEFAYPPFLFAAHLEQMGYDIYFQTTTRSPLQVGQALASAYTFIDNYEDQIPNYLYNVQGKEYDRVLACYETEPIPVSHQLPADLKTEVIQFGGSACSQ